LTSWLSDSELFLLHGHSRDHGIIEAAEHAGGYDMVFIDADHEYPSVLADWVTYGPMVNPGGMVVFHDITPRPMYGVDRLWREMKTQPGARTVEIVENSGRFNGIGVIWP
jgi:predicted O-methyltransferase YrrM